MENKMFCYQCQETAGCSGCTQSGVCGKKPDVAAAQDLLVYVTRGLLGRYHRAARRGKAGCPGDQSSCHVESVYDHYQCKF